MFCKMTSTTNVRFKKDTKQSFRVLSTTITVEVRSTKKKSKNFQILYFVICTPLGSALVAEFFSSCRICILVAEFKFFSGRIYFE